MYLFDTQSFTGSQSALPYEPVKILGDLVSKKFHRKKTFIEQVSNVYKENSSIIHYPFEPLKKEDIKKGLELYGLNTSKMNKTIGVLFELHSTRLDNKYFELLKYFQFNLFKERMNQLKLSGLNISRMNKYIVRCSERQKS